jgi:Cu/Ag efflux protein CusF
MMRAAATLLSLALAVAAFAQAPKPITKSNTVRGSATIQAIDGTTRSVTLRTKDGEEDTFQVSPDMKRFNELKVGDQVNFTYVESLVVQVRKPGAATPAGTTGDAAITRSAGKKPGATMAAQMQTTVTVKAIHPDVPSVTVVTADGRTVTRKIEDKKNLEGLKVGDQADITYTAALLMNVEPAKPAK